MQSRKYFLRAFFFLFLLTCLLTALVGTVRISPVRAISSSIVISQVYGGGGNTGAMYTNDFVELFNISSTTISLGGWSIQYAAAGSGGTTTWNVTNLSGSLLAGQYYLVQLAGGASGSALPTPDVIGTTNLNATDGKIALVSTTTPLSGSGCPFNASVVDFIGYGTTNCSETASAPSPSATIADIRGSECIDTDNNAGDFITNTPNPRNTSTFLNACLKVVNVTSSTPNGTYKVGDPDISIDITFSSNVNVDLTGGTPTLTLETGANDTKAFYASGSGTSILTFNYTIASGDTSGRLDYVDINSLLLNGATITGAVGDAVLTLPLPGGAGSLGSNKNIAVDNLLPPTVTINQASTQPDPAGAFPINFTVAFSEPIDPTTFASSDITQNGTAPGVIWAISPSSDHMTFTLSATSATGTGTIIPSIGASQITDVFGNGNIASTSTDNQVLYNTAPIDVAVEQAIGQLDPTGNTPINFTVTFSKAINASSFTTSDITQSGTATGVTWRITDSGDHITFTLAAIGITAPGMTTLQPSIQANKVTDIAGNTNNGSTSTDNQITFNNNIPPSVTINQAVGQADPATTLPIKFAVVFSEAIIPNIFTTSDITQIGTATGVTWTITDSGDHTNFALSATATSYGTMIPIISANRVTDLVGNNNLASTSTDNSVTYVAAPTSTPTRTPTRTSTPTRTPTAGLCGNPTTVVISEVAWGGTLASSTDEWMELYNPTNALIDLTNWKIKVIAGSTSTNIVLQNDILPKGYFLLEKPDDNTVLDVVANQIYNVDLPNSGSILQLYDPTGKCVDSANSNGGGWPAGSGAPTYYSMERLIKGGVPVSDGDGSWITNNKSSTWQKHDHGGNLIHGTPGYGNWAATVTPTPSKTGVVYKTSTPFRTSTPVPPPPPQLLGINEFVPRPGHDWNNDGQINIGDEYVELINFGVVNVSLSGYRLDDEANVGSTPFGLPAVTLKPGERRVFYESQTNIHLDDGGDGVRLIKPNGQLADAYNYSVVKYPDQSYCRLPDNGGLDDWNQDCAPTPGLRNEPRNGSENLPIVNGDDNSCPVGDTLPLDFWTAECEPFGNNIWSRLYWDTKGWLGEKILPNTNGQWDVYGD